MFWARPRAPLPESSFHKMTRVLLWNASKVLQKLQLLWQGYVEPPLKGRFWKRKRCRNLSGAPCPKSLALGTQQENMGVYRNMSICHVNNFQHGMLFVPCPCIEQRKPGPASEAAHPCPACPAMLKACLLDGRPRCEFVVRISNNPGLPRIIELRNLQSYTVCMYTYRKSNL